MEGGTRSLTEPVRRLVAFTQEAWFELKKVHWPSRAETQATTRVVVLVVLVVAAFLGAVDWVLSNFVQRLLGVGG